MGFFTNSMDEIYTWNSNVEYMEDQVKVFSIHGGGEYLSMPRTLYDEQPSPLFIENERIINGLLWKKKWKEETLIKNDADLVKELSNYNLPKSPQEKLDNLFEFLFNLQTADGEKFTMNSFWSHKYNSNMLFFKNENECNFYLKVLAAKGLIDGEFANNKGDNKMRSGNITFDGFEHYNKITNEGLKSNKCFVAMSFEKDASEIRSAIKSACEKTGFDPILIDEIHYDADTTINDAIIAQLKKSKFCVADFTHQKSGVYFESGYALGRGLKVIYSVLSKDLKNSHFDTKHFPHILYDTPEELETKLINKIEAWIKD